MNKEITTDTCYVFKLSTSKEELDTMDIWLRFDPVQEKLWDAFPGNDSLITELMFEKKMIKKLTEKCGG